MKHFLKILSLFSLSILLSCQAQEQADLTVGTIAGPETELVKIAQATALKRYGLKVKIIEFNDYNLPNEALADGSLDLNIYQHQPFLAASIKAKGYQIKAVGKTFIYPMGVYSNKHKTLEQIQDHALIAIPNDPSNETRALLLLSQANLIKINPEQLTLTPKDIIDNPRDIQIKELDAAQLPRILSDVDAAVINTSFAIPAGLNPQKDTLYLEDKNSPYANLIVARINSPKAKKIEQFITALQDQAVVIKAQELFGTGAIPAW
jgi:D-methionine transport system substrate-binding protein